LPLCFQGYPAEGFEFFLDKTVFFLLFMKSYQSAGRLWRDKNRASKRLRHDCINLQWRHSPKRAGGWDDSWADGLHDATPPSG
jgi:hypothetical protein